MEIAAHVRPTNPYRCLKSSLRILLTIVWFQKISIPSPRMVTGNSEGVGLSKAKILKENMKLNWNFQRGRGGLKVKKPSLGEVWVFSGTTNCASTKVRRIF